MATALEEDEHQGYSHEGYAFTQCGDMIIDRTNKQLQWDISNTNHTYNQAAQHYLKKGRFGHRVKSKPKKDLK